MQRRRYLLVGLVSTTLLGLELIWTRLMSAEFFYTYAYLVLSLAVMGIGFGALTLRLWPALGLRSRLGPLLALAGMMALAGPPLVFALGLDFRELVSSWSMVGRLAVAIVLLGAAFLLGGLALAVMFRRNHRDLPRLYMSDLLGAGIGVIAAIVLMNTVGTPEAAFLIALPMLGASVLASRGWKRLLPLPVMVAAIALAGHAADLLNLEREERAPVIYRHWDAMSKIKVLEFDQSYRGLQIDNAANSPVYGFDGDWERAKEEPFHFGIDVSNLIARSDGCCFLSLGSGGGVDVLQALQCGASEIHAVEVHGHINDLMRTGELADFSGYIYDDPRVTVVTEDARAYVRRFPGKFDMIFSLSSNSFAAVASGSFGLAENYLFTTEAFRDYWNALSPRGFMMMEHQFYMPRLVSSLADALQAEGVAEWRNHFAVYDLPQMRRKMILLSRQPLTDEIRNSAFGELTPEVFESIHLLYPAPQDLEENLINRIVRDGWRKVADSAPVNVSPATDNRPFVAQMGLWRNLSLEKAKLPVGLGVFGFPLSQAIIVVILAVSIVLALPLMLLPYAFGGATLDARSWFYFFVIGAAYMSVEVALIQRYTLLVGPSAYSIAAVLLALLVSSAMGSRFSPRVRDGVAVGMIVTWLSLEALVLPMLTPAFGGAAMPVRIVVAALLVLPLGFFMGMPFPKGASCVGPLVDWGFAVGGVASVIGAAGGLLVAITFGLPAVFLGGAVLYASSYQLLQTMRRRSGASVARRAKSVRI